MPTPSYDHGPDDSPRNPCPICAVTTTPPFRYVPTRTSYRSNEFEHVAQYFVLDDEQGDTVFHYTFNLCHVCAQWRAICTGVNQRRGGYIGARRLAMCRCELEQD